MNLEILFPIPRIILLSANGSYHRFIKMKRVKKLRELAFEMTKDYRVNFDKFSIEIYVYPPTKRSFDPPNYYPTVKPLVDGMTDAGLWEDDNHTRLTKMSFAYGGELSGLKDVFLFRMVIKGE